MDDPFHLFMFRLILIFCNIITESLAYNGPVNSDQY